jgi:molybdopterin synthase sulfur carrier subunit
MSVLVRIPTPLRRHTGGVGEVTAEGKDVGEVVDDLERQFPGLRDRLCDETGDFRKFINVYVNQEDVRFLQGRESLLKDGDEVSIVPAIAGGR